MEYVVQGRFLKPINFSNVYTGHAFKKAIAMKPPTMLVNILMPLINYFQPSAEIVLDGSSPYILSPLMVC